MPGFQDAVAHPDLAGGVLKVGAPADLVAWGDDIVEVAPEDVTDLPVHLTVVAGRVKHYRD